MKTKSIIILILIISMLFVNSSFTFAEEIIEEGELQLPETSEDNTLETNTYGIGNLDIDTSNYNGYIKPTGTIPSSETGIYQKDKFASYYFYNLKENFGYNTHGSCGYVATAMMLSYYDTYLDGNIIDDAYDVRGTIGSDLDLSQSHSSPGIKRESDSLSPSGVLYGLDCGVYKTVIDNNWQNYFHLYLIKLAESKFNMYHDTVAVLEECGIIWETNSQFPCASAMLHQRSLIEHYLWEVRGYEKSQVDIEYDNTNPRDFAIEKIKYGQPVMLFLGSTSGCHFVVAYDLDNKGTEDNSDDTIYAHYGWESVNDSNGNVKSAKHLNIDTDDNPYFISAMAIKFDKDFEHSHSNNYIDENGKEYCSCDLFIKHPNHECRHYKEYDDDYHQYLCGCSEELFEHNYVCGYPTLRYHYLYCVDCGYRSGIETHNYEYTNYNDNEHILTCANYGHQISEAHDYTHGYESINNVQHRGYCECGAYEEFDHEFTSSGTLDVCRYCKLEKDHVHEYVYLSSKDGRTHRKLCSCGVSVLEMCFGTTMPGAQATCMNCGQILNGGSITPWSISDDALPFNKEDDDYSE